MSRGRKPGNSQRHADILAALRKLGTEKDGRPKAIRAAALAECTGISHTNLSKTIAPLIESGAVVACLVALPRGRPTHEFRLGAGGAPKAFAPLNTRRAGVASAPAGKPLPTIARPATPASYPQDASILDRVQHMSEAEFGAYMGHLARVWAWAQAARRAA